MLCLGVRPAIVLLAVLAGLPVVACAARDNEESAAREAPKEGDLVVLRDVHLLAMDGEEIRRDRSIVIRGESIVDIVSADDPVLRGALVIEGDGGYVIPGLVDAHVHLRARSELASYLRHGVTTVVNLRGTPQDVALREAVESGVVDGPRIFTAGPLLDGDPPIWQAATVVVTSADQAAGIVRDHLRQGYDFVKIYNNLDPEPMRALIAEAHRAGLAVIGHLPRRPERSGALTRALTARLDLVAHVEEYFFTAFYEHAERGAEPPTDEELHAAARQTAAAGASVIPTLSFVTMTAALLEDAEAVWGHPEFAALAPDVQALWRESNPTRRADLESFVAREEHKRDVVRRLTRALHQEGVPILLGTDSSAPGMFPGASAHLELTELVAAGLSPYEALRSATVVPWQFLQEHVRGTPRGGVIAPGAVADLVVLAANPLDAIDEVRRIRGVMHRGRWLEVAR